MKGRNRKNDDVYLGKIQKTLLILLIILLALVECRKRNDIEKENTSNIDYKSDRFFFYTKSLNT